MLNRTVCLSMVLLSSSLLFTIPTNTMTPFLANNIKEKYEANKIEMVQDLRLNKFQEQYRKDNMELEKKKAEEVKRQKQLEEQKNNEPEWQEFILTFYTSLESENSSAGAVTCQNKPLSRGGVANNVIPQNTKIYLNKWGEVIVNDKGSNKHFSVDTRLDVYIPRESGENDTQYSRRVNKMGKQKVYGYIIK